MAQRVITHLIDDLDETSEASETVSFGLDGSQYEIDLTDAHAAELREALSGYIDAARRVSGGSRTGGRSQKRSTSAAGKSGGDQLDLGAVRAWARKQGMDVSERGRVSGKVLQAYRDAH